MTNHLLLSLLNSALGIGKHTSKDNYAFNCPCGRKPNKKKLEINLSTYRYQCWVCGSEKGGYKGNNLYYLFKRLNVSQDKLNEVKKLTSTKNKEIKIENNIPYLPTEFKSLLNVSSYDIVAKQALHYLKTRNITVNDIIKYNIGYCEFGEYRDMIVIPLYDCDANLVNFVGRTFKDGKKFYKMPNGVSKDIIANEHLINWNIPIVLCEGIFDAMAIKRNVIPLLGKSVRPNLMKKIISSKVSKIYIALDADAIKRSLELCEMLINNEKEVYLVDCENEDPSYMGFYKFTKLIQNTKPLTYYNLLKMKLNL